jgi:hypothetical protein
MFLYLSFIRSTQGKYKIGEKKLKAKGKRRKKVKVKEKEILLSLPRV